MDPKHAVTFYDEMDLGIGVPQIRGFVGLHNIFLPPMEVQVIHMLHVEHTLVATMVRDIPSGVGAQEGYTMYGQYACCQRSPCWKRRIFVPSQVSCLRSTNQPLMQPS